MPADDRLFGPNSEAVVALLRRLDVLEPAELRALVSFWRAVPDGARSRAHGAAQLAAESGGRRHEARRAQEEAFHWLDAAPDVGHAWLPQGDTPPVVRDIAQLRREAFPAVLDAVAGIVLADQLDPIALEVLVGPWEAATGSA